MRAAFHLLCASAIGLLAAHAFAAAASAQTAGEHLGLCAPQTNAPRVAIPACTALLQTETSKPALSGLHSWRAQSYEKQGDLAAALRDLDESVRLEPKKPGPYAARARLRIKLKAYAEGLADSDVVRKLDRSSANSLDLSCAVRAMADLDLVAARGFCDRALKMRPQHPEFLASRGMLRLRLSDDEGARTDYAEAVRWAPKYAIAHYGLGVALTRLGAAAEGAREIATAASVNPRVAVEYEGFGIRP